MDGVTFLLCLKVVCMPLIKTLQSLAINPSRCGVDVSLELFLGCRVSSADGHSAAAAEADSCSDVIYIPRAETADTRTVKTCRRTRGVCNKTQGLLQHL